MQTIDFKQAKELVRRGNKQVFDCGDSIVKLFNGTKAVSDIFNEALNLARVEEAGIRVPSVIEVGRLGDGWAIRTEKIEGEILAGIASGTEMLDKLIELQLSIHAHQASTLNRQVDKYSRMIKSLKVLDATSRYELQMRLDGLGRGTTSICHGDMNPTNIIVTEDGELLACDWAHATQGDPAADVAMSYLLFAMDDQNLAKEYLELYCARADMPQQKVYKWISVVAAAELARGRKKNEEFLRSCLNVSDYE